MWYRRKTGAVGMNLKLDSKWIQNIEKNCFGAEQKFQFVDQSNKKNCVKVFHCLHFYLNDSKLQSLDLWKSKILNHFIDSNEHNYIKAKKSLTLLIHFVLFTFKK